MTDRVGSPDILMVWPYRQAVPEAPLPDGYSLRSLGPREDQEWIRIHRLAVPSFGEAQLEGWLARYRELSLSNGILAAIDDSTGQPVATAGSIANSKQGMFPDGGQLAWVATIPGHQGRGLARALSAQATARLVRDGFRRVFLCTGDDLVPAIGLYRRIGYLPCLYAADQPDRWSRICSQLQVPFEPLRWPTLEEYTRDHS